jgi:hypothetical protein
MDMVALKVAMDTERGGHRVVLTVDETTIEAPPVEHLVHYAGLGVLAAVEIIEWPLALLLMAGHALMDATNRPALHEFGEVLEEA